jgi:nitroimidazol reductase NimA-like FMN-containing flavoprotein (pyridoxamine 5'-phosphate oxidase superfamily)
MSEPHEPQLKTLSRDECFEFLQGAVVGRIGYVADGMATIIPVNFALFDGCIVVCMAEGSALSWLDLRGRVAFEADESRAIDHAGWSVLVRGVAREVINPEELAVLRRGHMRSWLRSPQGHWVRISIEAMSGRALHGAPATDRIVRVRCRTRDRIQTLMRVLASRTGRILLSTNARS